ncbi:MAG: hypothetical protein ACOYT9_02055 [Patescibacteria group bacterium]|jgi:hypothetical protein
MTLSVVQQITYNLLAQAPSMILIDGSDPVGADPNSLVNKITTVGLSLGVAVAVILVSISGYKMMSSKGDAKGIQDAQDQIQNALMGFLLILLAVALVRIILGALGIADLVG